MSIPIQNMKRFALFNVVLFGIIILGIGTLLIKYPISGGMQFLPVNIIYEDNQSNYDGEKAKVSANKAIEGTIVVVRFYNLSFNKTYYISMSQVGIIKEFNETEEITIVMRAEEDNWCFLGGYNRDLIWIWIGEWS